MYEVNTEDEIDEAMELDGLNMSEVAREYASIAINEGYWEDIADDDTCIIRVRNLDTGTKRWTRFQVSLNQSTMKITSRRIA